MLTHSTCTHARHTHTPHTHTHTVSTFDTAKHFQTTPELVTRSYNRLTTDQLSNGSAMPRGQSSKVISPETVKELNHECAEEYQELNSRIRRHKELRRVAQKMQTKKELTVLYSRVKYDSHQKFVIIITGLALISVDCIYMYDV